ncbi:MAG: DUF1679 domain-containing protein [Pseudoalteromonas sp.]|nr:DUF1679 domain-containing protein [Pseudoalteromonas sp.]
MQNTHPGSLAEDLSRFLSTSVNSKVRRERTREVLNHYYDCLEKEFLKFGEKPPFSREDALGAFKLVN